MQTHSSLSPLPLMHFPHTIPYLPDPFIAVPFDLSQFPALRHVNYEFWLAITRPCFIFWNNHSTFQCQLASSRPLRSKIIWEHDHRPTTLAVCEEDLFSPDVGWSALDEILTSNKFVPLSKIILDLTTQPLGDYLQWQSGIWQTFDLFIR